MTPIDELQMSRPPRNSYGSIENAARPDRARRPLYLNTERWCAAHLSD